MQANRKHGVVALLLSSVCATTAMGQDFFFGPSIGQTWSGSVSDAYLDEALESDDTFVRGRLIADNGITFASRVELDNGLTFGAPVDLEGEDTGVEIDDSYVFLSGSFGNILVGNDNIAGFITGFGDYTIPNLSVPSGSDFNSCGVGSDARFSFDGIGLGVSYGVDLSDRSRGALAYDSAGSFRNPAVKIDYDLSGPEYTIGAGFCLDTQRLFPTYFTLALSGSDLSGSGDVGWQNFPNLGVTGVGGQPGVLINAPTDLLSGEIDVEREAYDIILGFKSPFRVNADGVLEEFIATPSGSGWRPVNAGPSIGLLSVVGNFNFGQVDQTEKLDFRANTPAFGVNSNWDASYRTEFDATRYGAEIGLQSERFFGARNGGTNSLSVTGLVGYQFYNIDVRDSVSAAGLGGALNYANREDHSYDDGVFTASITAGYSWQRGSQAFRLSAGIEYGHQPEFDYSRPDSTPAGAALDPKLDLEPDTRFVIGASYSYRF